jgi:histidyl-tRNA synthetase
MKKIVITKKTVTTISKKPTIDSIVPNHLKIFKILQHSGFRHTQKPEHTNLEKKLLSKYDAENLIDTLALQKKILDKKFEGFTFPANVAYSQDENNFAYHIIGTKKNIYDAIAMETAYAVLEEIYGKKSNIVIDVNFVGDKESVQKFTKELNHFFKKNQKFIPKNALAASKKNIYTAFSELDGVEIISTSKRGEKEAVAIPNPIDYLSEASRLEFKDILEYIENLDLNFRINPFLFNNNDLYAGIIFQVQNLNEEKGGIVARGGRHDIISKKILSKKEIPIISVTIEGLKNVSKLLKPLASLKTIDEADVKFFYAQFGNEARFKTLRVLDMMRGANILIHHDLSKDKISAQLQHAEKLNVPYLLLVGHREALQNSVMVRNMKNLSQESIEMANLIEYIKKLL